MNTTYAAVALVTSVVINPVAASNEYKAFKREAFVMNGMPEKRTKRAEPTAEEMAEVEKWMVEHNIM